MSNNLTFVDIELGELELVEVESLDWQAEAKKSLEKADTGDGQWITVNGQHIFISNNSNTGAHGGGTSKPTLAAQSAKAGSINGMPKQDVKQAILEQAQNNPHVKDPEKLANELTQKYAEASSLKRQIDSAADKVASEIPGARVVKTPLKGFKEDGSFNPSRAIDKFNEEGAVRDLARNSIIVNNVSDATRASELLSQQGIDVRRNYFNTPTELGYRGINSNHNSGAGEVQINVPSVVYYKEPSSVSRSILGDKTFHAVEASAQNVGLPAGAGHQLYEQYRNIETKAITAGRATTLANGQKQYRWTASEKSTVSAIVAQSNKGYELAIKIAK